MATATQAYEKELSGVRPSSRNVIGFLYAINGKLDSGDVYASAALFNKMYPKLLHAAAVEALSQRPPNSQGRLYDVAKAEVVEQMIKAVDAANGQSLAMDAGEMEREINSQADLKMPASGPRGGNRAIIVKKRTDQMELYETWDSETSAGFLHRAYLTK